MLNSVYKYSLFKVVLTIFLRKIKLSSSLERLKKLKISYKTLLLEGIHAGAQNTLEKEGIEVLRPDGALSSTEIIPLLKNISFLGLRSRAQITKEVLAQSDLMALGAFCIGVNQIDLKTAQEKGIPVFNAPHSNTRSVSELVISLMISLARQWSYLSSLNHQGIWKKTAKGSFEVREKALGIIGYGHIGCQVSVLAEALGMKVFYYDIAKILPMGNAQPLASLKELLNISDFVTLHVPETSETKNLINKAELKEMKKGSYLINTSRGSVVNIPDLVPALESKHLAGVALDVFPEEPKKKEDSFSFVLQNKPNVILTPHIGGSTEEAQKSIGKEVSISFIDYLFLGSTEGAVNFPQLAPPAIPKDSLRITNIHNNQPGILGKINSIASQLGVNIKAQYLSTKDNIGYLIMDVEKEKATVLYEHIQKLDTSIKTRILS